MAQPGGKQQVCMKACGTLERGPAGFFVMSTYYKAQDSFMGL